MPWRISPFSSRSCVRAVPGCAATGSQRRTLGGAIWLDEAIFGGYHHAMTSNIAELKDHLSQFLRRVRAGETIWVKDRDRIIAKIEPVRDDERQSDDEAWMADLVANGVAQPPKEKMTKKQVEELLSEPVKPRKKVSAVATLLRERVEGR